ncbi:MAG: SRPBCC domain-containing protein [Devosia sp.]
MADSINLSTEIAASPAQVWKALTDPKLIKSYMMGATVETDWEVGHPITWSGDYQGNAYVDKGEVKAFEPQKRLSVTHWSPLSKLPDTPDNYHTLTYDLLPAGKATNVTLTQQNLTGVSAEQARKNWQPMLDGLKRTAEA